MSITIRKAVPEDFEAIADLTVAAYLAGGHLQPSDSYISQLRDVASRAAAAQLLVAVHDGQVAASAVVTDHDGDYAEVSRPGEMEFRMLSVSPEHQGHGIARKLVRHIVKTAEARQDITSLTLCSMVTMTAAHRLYRSEGFMEKPERELVLDIEGKQARFPFFIRPV